MEELVQYIDQTPKPNAAKYWKDAIHLLPSPLFDSYKPKSWKKLYSLSSVQSSLSRIKVVGYDEKRVRINFYYFNNFAFKNKFSDIFVNLTFKIVNFLLLILFLFKICEDVLV